MRAVTRAIVDAAGEIVAVVTGDAAAIERNTPPGHVAVADPPPAPDAYRVGDKWALRPEKPAAHMAWDAERKQWADMRTAAEIKRRMVIGLQDEIQAREAAQARPLRELLLAVAEGKPLPAEPVNKLAEIESTIAALREQMRQQT